VEDQPWFKDVVLIIYCGPDNIPSLGMPTSLLWSVPFECVPSCTTFLLSLFVKHMDRRSYILLFFLIYWSSGKNLVINNHKRERLCHITRMNTGQKTILCFPKYTVWSLSLSTFIFSPRSWIHFLTPVTRRQIPPPPPDCLCPPFTPDNTLETPLKSISSVTPGFCRV
jgi:hypothetical protein